MIIFGIDPGFTGGIAALDTGNGSLEVFDMPVLPGAKGKVELNMREVLTLLAPRGDTQNIAVIEKVSAMPKQGVSSTFRFGEGYGALQMAIMGHGHVTHFITPQQWKKHFKLSRDKGASRSLASQRFPQNADMFKRVKDDGRAEAALLALYGRETLAQQASLMSP